MNTDSENLPKVRWGRGIALAVLTLALVVLHQDVWNWTEYKPMLFGFVPIGLGYHAGFAVACSVLMWLYVRLLWPKHLEELENTPPPSAFPPSSPSRSPEEH